VKSKIFKGIPVSLLFLYFVYCVYHLFVNRQEYQWDFKMQYHAAQLLAEGSNPYDIEALKARTGNPYWYAYPPSTLRFYRLFTLTDYNTAYSIFLLLKAGMVIGLVLLWRTKFVAKQAGDGFYFFCLLAFNSAIFLDMRAGNINMLEQLMLWIGFYFFLERRFLLFGFFILLGASFKLAPAVFLGLFLLTNNKKKYLYFFGSCVVFASYLLVQYAAAPDMFRAFLAGAKWTLVERGIVSPSTIGILKDGFEMLYNTTGIAVPEAFQLGLFYIIAAVIFLVSSQAYLVLKSLETEDKEKIILFLACFVYALIHPRLKDYACVLLIVPSYFIINRMRYLKAYPFLFLLVILSAANVTLPGLRTIYVFMWTYYPLVIAYFMWSLYLYEIYALREHPVESQEAANNISKKRIS
jgi:hypothetical protein